MSRFLALFPLKLVVFPREKLNLHIFEPRYRQLINDCEEERKSFGIAPFIDGRIAEYGTEVELLQIAHRYEDGKMDIKTRGIGIFKIEKFHRDVEDKLYSGAKIIDQPFSDVPDPTMSKEILNYLGELNKILDITQIKPAEDKPFFSFNLAHLVGFSLDQELVFLTIQEEYERQQFMLEHLQRLIPIARDMNLLKKKARMNGHFKNFMPPEF